MGAARIVQSNILKSPIRSAAENIASQDPKVADWRKVIFLHCARCHADDVTGDADASLRQITETDQRIKFTILNGIKGEMPAFGKKLNENDAALGMSRKRDHVIPPCAFQKVNHDDMERFSQALALRARYADNQPPISSGHSSQLSLMIRNQRAGCLLVTSNRMSLRLLSPVHLLMIL